MRVDGFGFRPYDPSRTGERHWIIKTWLACDRSTPDAKATGPAYMRTHGKWVEGVLERPGVVITVAHTDTDPDALAGFVVREGSKLHYVYVRKCAQHLGLGRALCEGLGPDVVTTHQPLEQGRALPAGWRYEREHK